MLWQISQCDGWPRPYLRGEYMFMEGARKDAQNTMELDYRWYRRERFSNLPPLDEGYAKAMAEEDRKEKLRAEMLLLPSEMKKISDEMKAMRQQYEGEMKRLKQLQQAAEDNTVLDKLHDTRTRLKILEEANRMGRLREHEAQLKQIDIQGELRGLTERVANMEKVVVKLMEGHNQLVEALMKANVPTDQGKKSADWFQRHGKYNGRKW